jgi:hypothetical protein
VVIESVKGVPLTGRSEPVLLEPAVGFVREGVLDSARSDQVAHDLVQLAGNLLLAQFLRKFRLTGRRSRQEFENFLVKRLYL